MGWRAGVVALVVLLACAPTVRYRARDAAADAAPEAGMDAVADGAPSVCDLTLSMLGLGFPLCETCMDLSCANEYLRLEGQGANCLGRVSLAINTCQDCACVRRRIDTHDGCWEATSDLLGCIYQRCGDLCQRGPTLVEICQMYTMPPSPTAACGCCRAESCGQYDALIEEGARLCPATRDSIAYCGTDCACLERIFATYLRTLRDGGVPDGAIAPCFRYVSAIYERWTCAITSCPVQCHRVPNTRDAALPAYGDCALDAGTDVD